MEGNNCIALLNYFVVMMVNPFMHCGLTWAFEADMSLTQRTNVIVTVDFNHLDFILFYQSIYFFLLLCIRKIPTWTSQSVISARLSMTEPGPAPPGPLVWFPVAAAALLSRRMRGCVFP